MPTAHGKPLPGGAKAVKKEPLDLVKASCCPWNFQATIAGLPFFLFLVSGIGVSVSYDVV